MAQYVYTMNRVGKIVPPKREILKDISLSFFPGAKIGVLGLNGSGKSTLLRIMAGVDQEFEGEAMPMPDMRIGYLPQEPQLDPDKTVRETVEEGLGRGPRGARRSSTRSTPPTPSPTPISTSSPPSRRSSRRSSPPPAPTPTCSSRSPPTRCACRRGTRRSATLSGGEKRRVALCRLLLSKPDMLLLDEPTNHLDAESVEWLEQFLQRFPGTVVAVTHDRYFLDNAAEWILELDRGYGIPWKGNYSSWLEQKEAAPRDRGEAGRRRASRRCRRSSSGCGRTRRAARRRARRASRASRSCRRYEYQKRNETQEIFIPVAERLGDAGDRVQGRAARATATAC